MRLREAARALAADLLHAGNALAVDNMSRAGNQAVSNPASITEELHYMLEVHWQALALAGSQAGVVTHLCMKLCHMRRMQRQTHCQLACHAVVLDGWCSIVQA